MFDSLNRIGSSTLYVLIPHITALFGLLFCKKLYIIDSIESVIIQAKDYLVIIPVLKYRLAESCHISVFY